MVVPRLLSDFYSEYVTHTLMIDLFTSVKSLWEKKISSQLCVRAHKYYTVNIQLTDQIGRPTGSAYVHIHTE